MCRRRGFTLTEIVIGLFVGALVLATLYQIFVYFWRGAESPMAAMDIEQSTLSAVRWMQRDLGETNLQSIRSDTATGVVSMLTARNPSESYEDDRFELGMESVVWQRSVAYRLIPVPDHAERAQLVRVYVPKPPGNFNPIVPNDPPAIDFSRAQPPRVMGNAFLPARQGGFKVYWTDASGQPHDFGASAYERAAPVRVSFTLQTTSATTGTPTRRTIEFAVTPQN